MIITHIISDLVFCLCSFMGNTEDVLRVTFKQLFDEFWKTDSEQAKVAKEHGCGKEDVSVCMRMCSFSFPIRFTLFIIFPESCLFRFSHVLNYMIS